MTQEVQTINRARDRAQREEIELSGFDYSAPAELFPSRSKKTRGPISYKRFSTAAQAIRFAIEELPTAALLGACLEVNESRFGREEIHYLYESSAYPLTRSGVSLAGAGVPEASANSSA